MARRNIAPAPRNTRQRLFVAASTLHRYYQHADAGAWACDECRGIVDAALDGDRAAFRAAVRYLHSVAYPGLPPARSAGMQQMNDWTTAETSPDRSRCTHTWMGRNPHMNPPNTFLVRCDRDTVQGNDVCERHLAARQRQMQKLRDRQAGRREREARRLRQ